MGRRNLLLIAGFAALAAVVVLGGQVGASQPGGPHRLTPIVDTGGGIKQSITSPDGSTLVYRSQPVDPGPEEFWSVRIEGGSPIRLTPLGAAPSSIKLPKFVPDSTRVVYVWRVATGEDSDDLTSLYSAPVNGGTPTRLVGPVGGDHAVRISTLAVSSDSLRAVYAVTAGEAGEVGIWSVELSGLPPIRLSAEPTTFQLLPDATGVVYPAADGLFFVALDGGAPVQLHSLGTTSDRIGAIRVSPDSQRVVFTTVFGSRNSATNLFSVPVRGGPTAELSTTVPSGRAIRGLQITPDSSTVIYRAGVRSDTVMDLLSVPIDGGAPTRLNQDLAASGTITWFGVTEDSRWVAYLIDAEGNGETEPFITTPTGGSPRTLSGPLPPGTTVGRVPVLSPDSTRFVFVQNRVGSLGQDQRLRSASILGGPPVDIARSLEFVGRTFVFTVSPDSSRVIVTADPNVFDAPGSQATVYSIPIGGGPPVRLFDPAALPGALGEWAAVQTDDAVTVLFSNYDDALDEDTALYAVDAGVVRCAGRPTTIVGTGGADVLTGSPGPDVILAGAGADEVNGGGGDDLICGQDGDDTLNGDDGADTIWGDAGDDTIKGGAGPDQVHAGPGADEVRGGSGPDVLSGDGGADRIWGGSSGDTIDGGPGKDELRGQSGADTIYGRKGADRIWGNKGADAIRGGSGGDTLRGGSGRDTLRGGSGGDTLRGGSGRDRCIGGPGRDRLSSCE